MYAAVRRGHAHNGRMDGARGGVSAHADKASRGTTTWIRFPLEIKFRLRVKCVKLPDEPVFLLKWKILIYGTYRRLERPSRDYYDRLKCTKQACFNGTLTLSLVAALTVRVFWFCIIHLTLGKPAINYRCDSVNCQIETVVSIHSPSNHASSVPLMVWSLGMVTKVSEYKFCLFLIIYTLHEYFFFLCI